MIPTGINRRSLLRGVPSLTPTAATLLGLRLGRATILRISFLLALRSALSSISLPLDSSVLAYVWTFLFSSVQTSVAFAAAANYLNWGGILGAVGRRLFAPSDAPFVALYGALVALAGPAVAVLEAAVLTFELMRLSRLAEGRMRFAERTGSGSAWRRAILVLSAVCALATAAIAWALHAMCPGALPAAAASIAAALLGVSVLADDANVLEGALLALYAALVLALGYIEELDVPTLALELATLRGTTAPLPYVQLLGVTHDVRSDYARAIILATTTLLLLLALARAPRLMRAVAIGGEALKREDDAAASAVAQLDGLASDTEPAAPIAGTPWWTGLLNGFSVVAVTFRVLVWAGEIYTGEYYPLFCRGVQAVAILVFYVCYLRADELAARREAIARAPKPRLDIAGNVIPE